jgi:hypothetical protein
MAEVISGAAAPATPGAQSAAALGSRPLASSAAFQAAAGAWSSSGAGGEGAGVPPPGQRAEGSRGSGDIQLHEGSSEGTSVGGSSGIRGERLQSRHAGALFPSRGEAQASGSAAGPSALGTAQALSGAPPTYVGVDATPHSACKQVVTTELNEVRLIGHALASMGRRAAFVAFPTSLYAYTLLSIPFHSIPLHFYNEQGMCSQSCKLITAEQSSSHIPIVACLKPKPTAPFLDTRLKWHWLSRAMISMSTAEVSLHDCEHIPVR